MPDSRKKWSFRRWRRRWNDRLSRLVLRWRIWFDRHILSHETRRAWRRRWKRRSERIGRVVERAGYKVLPHKPDAAPNTGWARFAKQLDDFGDRFYPPQLREQHSRAFSRWWHEFNAPFRHGNLRVRRWLSNSLLPTFTPAGFRKKFFNWRGAAVGVAVAGLIAAIPLWLVPQWSAHQEFKRAAQARLLLNRGYQSLAYQHAIQVLRQDEHNEEACRVIADMLDRQGLPEALSWRRKVVQESKTATNQLCLAATALRVEASPSPTASRIIASISGPETNSVQFQVVAAQLNTKEGDLRAAEQRYLMALGLEPANAEVELALALLRLQMRNADRIALAEETLGSLATRSNMTIRALRPLMTLSGARGDYEAALGYSQRILSDESSTFEDRLAHLDILAQKRDSSGDKFLSTLQDQVSTSPLYVAQLGGWLCSHGRAREALAWYDRLPSAIQKADLVLLATADAYVAEADWRGLEKFLMNPRQTSWGTIEFVRQAMLARAYLGMGERRPFADHFQRAKDLASGMSVRLTNLARLVAKWGWDAEIEELLWTVLERFPNETWAADALLKRYYDRGQTEGIQRVFTLQLKRQPQDVPLKNNLAMVLLLLRTNLPMAHELALEAHTRNPESAVHSSTYAFSLYVQGKPEQGRRIMEAFDPELLKVPSIAAYYAIIAAGTGDKAAAGKYLEFARQARLLPEERALLDQVRSGL